MTSQLPFAFTYLGFIGMSWFEIGMLFCFGASWPFSIYKMLHARSSAGKSFIFLYLVLIGYVCGILHKIIYHCDVVVFLYTLNFLMVLADTLLCYYFRKHSCCMRGNKNESVGEQPDP